MDENNSEGCFEVLEDDAWMNALSHNNHEGELQEAARLLSTAAASCPAVSGRR